MREIPISLTEQKTVREKKILLPAVVLMIAAAIVGGLFLLMQSDLEFEFINPEIFSWLLLTAITTTAPLFYYWYKGNFDLFNPIVFASWSYFIPVFVVGGLIFTTGFFKPYYAFLIQDPKNDLPMTFLYINTGFLGLWAGYEISLMSKLGKYFAAKFPVLDWEPSKLILPGYVLLAIGIFFNITNLTAGILMGFQNSAAVDAFDNIQYFLSLLILEGAFLLWIVLFQTKTKNVLYYVNWLVLIIIVPLRMILLGNRGGLFQLLILVSMAYFFSGKKLTPKKGIVFTGCLAAAILIGMIWGNAYRTIKGDDSRISTDQYIDTVGQTVDSIASVNLEESFVSAFNSFSERLENFSALAVVVSNYEKLAPYEEAYGLKDNIWTYTWTAFIPRFIWNDKPVVSGARIYSELYFNYGDNAFPITPMGDLLRNFGSYGVPLGMFVLGMFLRFIYSLLIEGRKIVIWCGMAYFMLITKVSYEGFYGTILPEIIRTVFIILISLLIIKFIIKKS